EDVCAGGDGTDRSQAPFHVPESTRSPEGPVIAVARDPAFHFYYPENLEALEAAGARLAFFSPLADPSLPAGTRGIYIGGGFPEVFAAQLAENRALGMEVRAAADAGIPVLAECGGLMYLCRSLEVDGRSYPMAGVVPAAAVLTRRLQRCGYVTAVALRDTCLGVCGTALRGHVFHYSRLIPEGGWPAAFRLVRSDGTEAREGMVYRNVLASYVHFHFTGHPEAARRFVACAAG
ncbi:MAG: cobyrinate a,c-diamide synthase, partial [Desulfotomaculales bacterium]